MKMMLTPDIRERFEEALSTAQLHSLALSLEKAGMAPGAVFVAFEEFMLHLRENNREADEDVIADAMDCISGWCTPDKRWFGREIQNSETATYRK